MAAPKEKTKPGIKLELSLEEVNIVLESLSKEPFRQVYKLIEKIHLQAKESENQK